MNEATNTRFWRTAGPWLASVGGLLMLVNAVRAATDAQGFAQYLGLPLANVADASLIYVYALRALFIGLLIIGLLIARQRTALAILATVAVVMPIGDAVLASNAAAPTGTILRHVAIAVFLIVAALVLWREARRSAAKA